MQKKVVYVYDPAEDSAYIVDTPLDFIGGHGEIMGMSSDYIYSFGKAEKLEFISSPHIFGTRAKKTLWTVEADCPSPVEIDVAGGGYLRTLSAPYGRAYAHLRSRQFVFFIRAGDEVRSLSAKAEVIDEV